MSAPSTPTASRKRAAGGMTFATPEKRQKFNLAPVAWCARCMEYANDIDRRECDAAFASDEVIGKKCWCCAGPKSKHDCVAVTHKGLAEQAAITLGAREEQKERVLAAGESQDPAVLAALDAGQDELDALVKKFKADKRGVSNWANKQVGGVPARKSAARGSAASGDELARATFMERRRTGTMLRALVEVRVLFLNDMKVDTSSVSRILGEYDVREDVGPAAEGGEDQEAGVAGEEQAARVDDAVEEAAAEEGVGE